MSWLFRIFRRSGPQVQQGLLIPHTAPTLDKTKTTALAVRPVMALVPVAVICVALYTQASSYVADRFAQPASPLIVTADTWPYQQRTVAFGSLPELAEPAYFATLKNALIAQEPTLLVVDAAAGKATLYQNTQATAVMDIRDVAGAGSWRQLSAGFYQVQKKVPERYSSLERAYYPSVLEFNQRVAVHGPGYRNDGSLADGASLGVTLAAADAASLYELVATSTPVLVHVPDETTAAAPARELVPMGPHLAVRSYLVRDIATNKTLAAYQADTAVPIASLTKLMTALVVAETYDLEGEITINQEQYVTTLIPRLPGTRQTSMYDLLQLLLLESSNEAAEVLASHQGRTQFIAAMNERAASLGLTDTFFVDPSGLDAGNQSSAEDLYTLTQYIYEQYPFILDITSREGAIVAARANDFADLENFNEFATLDTFVGGKIGEIAAAKQTSVTIHALELGEVERDVAIIVLGSEARSDDVTRLHTFVTNTYR